MEQIINYRDIPTDKRLDILNALERIGFFPAYGGVKTMQQIMEKSVPGSGPQFYFVFRENELIGYNFLIGDTKKYKAFPWLAMGSGTTGMVAAQMGRHFVGIELNPAYTELAYKRIGGEI